MGNDGIAILTSIGLVVLIGLSVFWFNANKDKQKAKKEPSDQ